MKNAQDWRSYVTDDGDFALPSFIYTHFNSLMKFMLDLGTLLSDDRGKLRAYKEQTKTGFKSRWLEIAEVFEYYGLIVPCGCSHTEFCAECGGSRYRLNSDLSPDEFTEIDVVTIGANRSEIQKKLQAGLQKAREELGT